MKTGCEENDFVEVAARFRRGKKMDAAIFKKLANRYQEKGLTLKELTQPSIASQNAGRKYQLVKRGKVLKILDPAELLEDARKRGIVRTDFG